MEAPTAPRAAAHTHHIKALCVIEGDTKSVRLHAAQEVHCCVTERQAEGMWAVEERKRNSRRK